MGLLVAGVTGGASLIKSAKINKICNGITEMRQAWSSYYAQFGTIAGIKDDGEWDSGQALVDISNAGIIDNSLIRNRDAYCINGVASRGESKMCKDYGLVYGYNTIWDNSYAVFSLDEEGLNGKMFDEELDRTIDKKLDDGDPDTGRIQVYKDDPDTYVWDSLGFLLDL